MANINDINIFEFYKGKNVLVTGHTGFKGSWMTEVLLLAGANVTGYSLKPPTDPSLFEVLELNKWDNSEYIDDTVTGRLTNVYKDIRDIDSLQQAFNESQPEIVIHMAAQPLVRESYINPVGTYETNVIGTVNVLECSRNTASVKSIVNVTTDKVYRNYEREEGYKEGEELCGYDPYSNSKSCSELVTDSYRNSFLRENGIVVTTMRAGNVIGGGDFAADRIVPDCFRAASKDEKIVLRNPYSTRPFQHVLEPVMCYLRVAALQLQDKEIEGAYNIGPEDTDAITTGEIAKKFSDNWGKCTGNKVEITHMSDGGPHEAKFLKLDCTKIKTELGWNPSWDIDDAIRETVGWYVAYKTGDDIKNVTEEQIIAYHQGASLK